MKFKPLLFICLFYLSNLWAQQDSYILLSVGPGSSEFFLREPLGYQINATFAYQLSEFTSIISSTGIYSFEELYPTSVTNEFKTIPLLMGALIRFPAKSLEPYLSLQLGLHFIQRDYIFQEYEISNFFMYNLISSEERKDSSTNFAFRIEIGTSIPITHYIGINVDLRYDSIYYKYIDNYRTKSQSSKIGLHSINFGLKYQF